MLHKKIIGLFRALPEESLDIKFIARVTNTDENLVKPILEQLVKDKHIKGKRKFKLDGEYLKDYEKNAKFKKLKN